MGKKEIIVGLISTLFIVSCLAQCGTEIATTANEYFFVKNCSALNYLIMNPNSTVKAATSTTSTKITTVYGGSYTWITNLVPGITYTFQNCEAGFDSVFVLRDSTGNYLYASDDCQTCVANDKSTQIVYAHPLAATFSSASLSVFYKLPNSAGYSCTATVGANRKMDLFQSSSSVPACSDYAISCIDTFTLPLTGGSATLSPSDIIGSTFESCGMLASLSQTVFTCSNVGINYVKLSFYDYSCVTQVNVTVPAPTLSCDSTYIYVSNAPDCHPQGCPINLYDNLLATTVTAQCSVVKTFPAYQEVYIGDAVTYTTYLNGVAYNCPVRIHGIRINNVYDGQMVYQQDQNFDITGDYFFPGVQYQDFGLFIIDFADYNPYTDGPSPDWTKGIMLTSSSLSFSMSPNHGGFTFQNVDFSKVPLSNYYLFAYILINTTYYPSIGTPLIAVVETPTPTATPTITRTPTPSRGAR
jgi:hypothetical protein